MDEFQEKYPQDDEAWVEMVLSGSKENPLKVKKKILFLI